MPTVVPVLLALIAPERPPKLVPDLIALIATVGMIVPPIAGKLVDRSGDAKPLLLSLSMLNICFGTGLLVTCATNSVTGLVLCALMNSITIAAALTINAGLTATFQAAAPEREGTVMAAYVAALTVACVAGLSFLTMFPMSSTADVEVITAHLAVSVGSLVVMAMLPRSLYLRRTFIAFQRASAADANGRDYRALLLASILWGAGLNIAMQYAPGVSMSLAEDWGGGKLPTWDAEEVRSTYSAAIRMGIVAALPLIPLVGLLIDYIGPLPVMYLSAYCVFAEYAVLAYFPPSQMLLEAYWLTASAPVVSMNMSWLVFLRSKLLPDPLKMNRDLGLYMLVGGASAAAVIAFVDSVLIGHGSILVGYGTTETRLLDGDEQTALLLDVREQAALEGYSVFFLANSVIVMLGPVAAHLAARSFPPAIRLLSAQMLEYPCTVTGGGEAELV
mmetsp:Transcript_72296/g.217282  ORF Transcript_72296/g.217282 Transcript_72296/m.217282 type:complete len:446 (+) Transcript_72296:71-1408(+)